MQNIKKIIFCVVSCSQLYHYGFALDAAGVKAVKVLKEALENSSDKLAEGGKKIAETLAQGSVEASSKLGVEAATEIAKSADKLAIVGQGVVLVGAVYQVCSIAKDVKSCVWPSKEDKAREVQAEAFKEEMEEKYELLKAKREFRKCLLNNTHSKRNDEGCPCACENLAQLFAMAGGAEDVAKMTSVFRYHYKIEG